MLVGNWQPKPTLGADVLYISKRPLLVGGISAVPAGVRVISPEVVVWFPLLYSDIEQSHQFTWTRNQNNVPYNGSM